MVTPMGIADFETFLTPVLDKKLSRLHKGTIKVFKTWQAILNIYI